jgi:hypothetical protein
MGSGVLKPLEDAMNNETGRWLNWNFVIFAGAFQKRNECCNVDMLSGRSECVSQLPNKINNERGDSVVEFDNFKSTLLTYKAPLQEVRDSL